MNFNKITIYGAAIVATVLVATQAFAAGYEKAIMWGGHSAGVAGVATPWTSGAEALYFNPAGLATDKPGKSVAFDISPTSATFSGPINFNNDVVSSSSSLTTPAALIYSQTITDSIGLGLGFYTSGGAKAIFENVDMQSGRTANLRTNLAINEIALGMGYKLNDQWKFGGSIRYVMGAADYAFIVPKNASGSLYANTELNGLKANGLAFKFGTQYKATEKTRYSLVYRTEATLNGDGTWGGFLQGPTGSGQFAQNPATGHTAFPMQAVLGTEHDYEKWRAMAELVWTQYSRLAEISVDGVTSATAPAPVGTQTLNGAHVALNFRDEYSVRLAGEYMGFDWPIRFGMIYGTPVTDRAVARANLTPPGSSYVLSAGTGKEVKVGETSLLNFDGALEYDMVTGDSDGGNAPGAAIDSNGGTTRMGTYKVSAYAMHLGVGYSF